MKIKKKNCRVLNRYVYQKNGFRKVFIGFMDLFCFANHQILMDLVTDRTRFSNVKITTQGR
jgi:hypothetical protein